MSVDRDAKINDKFLCILCGHYLGSHLVMEDTIGAEEIKKILSVKCHQANRYDYKKQCDCDAGFKDVEITVNVREYDGIRG